MGFTGGVLPLAAYTWPGEDPVPLATTQFPSTVTELAAVATKPYK